jgi:hypothetical protein
VVADWIFDGLSAPEIEARIDELLAFVAISIDRGEDVLIGDDFQSRPMFGTCSLWELVTGQAPVQISGEIGQELAAWLGPAGRYTDSSNWPEGWDQTEISIDGGRTEDNPDVAWVHHTIRSGRAMGSLSIGRHGPTPTQTSLGVADVHFVRREADRIAFWREAIVVEGDNADSLARLGLHAYPEIHFLPGVLDEVNQLGGGYLAIRAQVQAAFAALNDYGGWIFTTAPPPLTPTDGLQPDPAGGTPSNQIIERRFRQIGLDVAPENPNVRQTQSTRLARERVLGKQTIYCEWHLKLEPHRNRIHIHGPAHGVDRIIVAIIHEHLPLP